MNNSLMISKTQFMLKLLQVSQKHFPVDLCKWRFKWGPHITWSIFFLGFFSSVRVPFTLIFYMSFNCFKKQWYLSCRISPLQCFVDCIRLLSFNIFTHPRISSQLASGSAGSLDSVRLRTFLFVRLFMGSAVFLTESPGRPVQFSDVNIGKRVEVS